MASIENAPIAGKGKAIGVPKAKKLSTRVDMTPMVDLGFLLITFFIFTATLNTPTTMKLILPHDAENNPMPASESGALTIILDSAGVVHYYERALQKNGENMLHTDYKNLRNIIIHKKREVIAAYVPNGSCEERVKAQRLPISTCYDEKLTVICKATAGATYKNIVDLLDEMTINRVKRFALVPLLPHEVQALENKIKLYTKN